MKVLRFLTVSSLLVMPIHAQFGLKKKGRGSSFQELNEMMKEKMDEAGSEGMDAFSDLESLQKLMAEAMNDPESVKAIQGMQQTFANALEEMSKMDPEEMQNQMQNAMKMMTDGTMIDSIIEKKEDVLASLKESGLVPESEIAKYEADPEYFESQMRSAFGQMAGIFNNPDLLSAATETLKGLGSSMNDPIAIEMGEILMAEELDDVRIEELRLSILQNPDALSANPVFAEMVASEDFQDQLQDTKKWKEGLIEAREMMKGASDILAGMEDEAGNTVKGMGAGAGVGEL